MGYESDEDLDNGARPAGLIRLSTTTGAVPEYLQDYGNTTAAGTTTHHVTQYKAPSGALVFSAGSIQWAWGLDATHDGDGAPADSRMQQATVNLLADMSAQPVTLMAGLVAASKSTDTTAPTATVTSPVSGASIANGTLVTATGTAADVGGRVAGVEVSTDGGATWHPASGTTSWTYSYVQTGSGAASVRARAVDDSSNIGPSSTASSLTVSCPCSIFGAQVPTTPATTDSSAVELGLRFTPTVDGFVTGVRFYKGTGNGGTHTGTLWSAGGTALAQVTFAGESTTGWQQATFAQAVAVTAGTLYTVSYTAPQGHYAAASNAFYSAGIEAPPLRVAGGFGAQVAGVYSTPGTFPTTTFGSTNYYVDAIFELVDALPLTVLDRQPLAGATSVPVGTDVTAVFSRDIEPASQTLTLTPAGGSPVAGTTTYAAGTRTVRLVPSSPLSPSTTYTAQVGARDASGGAITGSVSWTFRTAAADQVPGGSPVSLYNDSDQPVVLDTADPGPVTVGVRFASSVAGTVDAIRFYKGPNNTGTHLGALWRVSDGLMLGTVTFTGESTSGWQTAQFSSPIPIDAATEYVASYTAPVGRYSATIGGFTGLVVKRDPLYTDVDSGMYTYLAAPAYPVGRSSTSYYVDVVFTAAAPLPSVSSVSPVSGATSVGTGSSVSAVLSADPASGTPSIAVSTSAGAVAGSVAYVSGTRTVTFTPAAALPAGTVVSAVVSLGGVALTGGSWSFTTAAAPLPSVSSVSPVSGATSVGTGSSVSAVLSADPASGTPSIAVSTSAGAVAGSVAYVSGTRTVTFTPAAALPAGTVVSAVVSLGGVALTGGSWSFTTAAAPLPSVSSVSPVSGATSVTTGASVAAALSSAPASGTPVLALSTSGGAIAGTSAWSAATTTVTFTPAAALPAGTVVSAVVSLGGVALTGGSWSFTTAAAAPTGTAVERYITRVYSDLFHRSVDPTGLATWRTALTTGTPRVEVANSITGSQEYRSGLIRDAYQRYLGRDAEPAGLGYWLVEMTKGRTITDMEAGFLASDEYYLRSGSVESAWVGNLYQAVLGRAASSDEIAYWVARSRVIGRFAVAQGFLLSTERLTTVVDGYYVQLLGRHIDPTGQATWVGLLQRGARIEAIIGSIIASDEYYANV